MALIIGVFIAMLTPAVFSLPAEILSPSVQGIGFGVLLTLNGLGNAMGPIIAGFFRDLTGNYLWGFIAMSIMVMIAIIPMVILRIYGRKYTYDKPFIDSSGTY